MRQTSEQEDCKVLFDGKEVTLVSVELLMPNLIKRKLEISSAKGASRIIT